MKQVILNLRPENGTLSMINQTEIMVQEMKKYNLCDYNDAYTLGRGDVTVVAIHGSQVAFKNCTPFTKCITMIDGATIDDAEELDLVMPMYNLLEYDSNSSVTTGSLWFYSKDEATKFNNDIANTNNFNSFNFKAKLLGNIVAQPPPNQADEILKTIDTNETIVALLKYLKNIYISREMPLISCKIELKLRWKKHCALAAAVVENDGVDSGNIIFTI